MKSSFLVAAGLLMLASLSLRAQQDRDFMLQAGFEGMAVQDLFPNGSNSAERAALTIGRQLTGHNFYDPSNVMFLRPAVKELGLVRGVLATSDRLLRASKIGTADYRFPRGPYGIKEGPEAYSSRRLRPHMGIVSVDTDGIPLLKAGSFNGKSIGADYDFALYLIDNNLKQDALTLVSAPCYSASDTLYFLRGWAHYQLKQLEEAQYYFRQIPRESVFSDKSLFYSAAVSAHLGDYNSPVAGLKDYSGPYSELRDLQLSGLALLRDDPTSFKEASKSFAFSDFAITEAERTLCDIYDSRYTGRAKSPVVAAVASALLPGAGKIYAGKIGEGVSAFLLTGIMGAITAEHWVKDGPSNWKTIVPGLLGAVLYAGNIYGSYMSVSIYNTNLKDAKDTAVLYNIHIPLRTVFK